MTEELHNGLFSRAEWFLLPLSLRERWWIETDYGKLIPSDELKEAIRSVLNKIGDKGV